MLQPDLSSAVRWGAGKHCSSSSLLLQRRHRGFGAGKEPGEPRPRHPMRHSVNCGCPLRRRHLCCQRVHPSVPAVPCPRAHLAQSQVIVVFEKPFLDKAAHADPTRLFWEGISQFCPSSVEGKKLPRSWGSQQLCALSEEMYVGRAKYWFCTGFHLS